MPGIGVVEILAQDLAVNQLRFGQVTLLVEAQADLEQLLHAGFLRVRRALDRTRDLLDSIKWRFLSHFLHLSRKANPSTNWTGPVRQILYEAAKLANVAPL